MSSSDYYRHLQRRVQFEIAKMTWDGTLVDKIEDLPEKLAEQKSRLEDALLRGHIRLAMGQPPSNKGTLADSARQALHDWQNSTDIIKVMSKIALKYPSPPQSVNHHK